MFFTPEFFIESFQSTKKFVFRKLTDDKQLHDMADRYVDAQTQFAKMLTANFYDVIKYSFNKLTDCVSKSSQVSAPYKVETPVEKETN